MVLTHTAGVESHFLSLVNPVQWTARICLISWSWPTIKTLEPDRICPGESGSGASRQSTTAAEERLILSDIILEVKNQPPQPFVQSFV